MHFSTDVNDIKDSLHQRGHIVRNIANITHHQTKIPLSMFYIDLEPNHNNKDIFEIQYLLNARISFEPPLKKREIVQCKRCQQYGHTKRYCAHPFKCVKCGQDHNTVSCEKPDTTPAIYALCGGSYPANYRGCSVYKNIQKKNFPTQRIKKLSTSHADVLENQNTDQPTSGSTVTSQSGKKSSFPRIVTKEVSYSQVLQNDNSAGSNNSSDIQSLTTIIERTFERFEGLLTKQMEQIGSLLNLLTTLVTKLK